MHGSSETQKQLWPFFWLQNLQHVSSSKWVALLKIIGMVWSCFEDLKTRDGLSFLEHAVVFSFNHPWISQNAKMNISSWVKARRNSVWKYYCVDRFSIAQKESLCLPWCWRIVPVKRLFMGRSVKPQEMQAKREEPMKISLWKQGRNASRPSFVCKTQFHGKLEPKSLSSITSSSRLFRRKTKGADVRQMALCFHSILRNRCGLTFKGCIKPQNRERLS